MCSSEFWEYHCCIQCRSQWDYNYNVFTCVPPRGQTCPPKKPKMLPPLVHYEYACLECKDRQAAVENRQASHEADVDVESHQAAVENTNAEEVAATGSRPRPGLKPLVWSDQTGCWINMW